VFSVAGPDLWPHGLLVRGLNETRGSSTTKSTEKELLGRMLGNVYVPVLRKRASGCTTIDDRDKCFERYADIASRVYLLDPLSEKVWDYNPIIMH